MTFVVTEGIGTTVISVLGTRFFVSSSFVSPQSSAEKMIGPVGLRALLAGAAAPASMDNCPHQATDAWLHECVADAQSMGHITSPAIATQLQRFLDRADRALALGHAGIAVSARRSFIRLLENGAARGLLDASAAQHLVGHATLVLDALLHPTR